MEKQTNLQIQAMSDDELIMKYKELYAYYVDNLEDKEPKDLRSCGQEIFKRNIVEQIGVRRKLIK